MQTKVLLRMYQLYVKIPVLVYERLLSKQQLSDLQNSKVYVALPTPRRLAGTFH